MQMMKSRKKISLQYNAQKKNQKKKLTSCLKDFCVNKKFSFLNLASSFSVQQAWSSSNKVNRNKQTPNSK